MSRESYTKGMQSDDYWANVSKSYADRIDNPYHRHRLSVMNSLIAHFDGDGDILDFGCGDGVALEDFAPERCAGIDIDATLIELAKKRIPSARFLQGGVEKLEDVSTGSVGLLLSLNVNAYFTDAEDEKFYSEARRIVRPGGMMIISHSNTLFDLFTLNSFTRKFFEAEFGTDPSALLSRPNEPSSDSYNIRENPLSYGIKLRRWGFAERRQEFVNFHPAPPMLREARRTDEWPEYRDTLNWPEGERWKLQFQCSTFAALAVRED